MSEREKMTPDWPHAVQAVAFDMDGLLLNTEELYFIVGAELLGRRGKIYRPELRRAMMGLPGHKALTLMIDEEGLSDTWQALESECDEIFNRLLETSLAPMAGVHELLDELDQHRIPRCVATSSRRVFAEKSLGMVKLLSRFEFVITAEDVPRGKPFPDIYEAAAERMGVRPHEMIALEDSGHGCASAVASGACTIAVPGDHSRDHQFAGVAYIADTLQDPGIRHLLRRGRSNPG